MTKDQPEEKIDPDLAAAIKDRESRTDRYGSDLISLVLCDLCDPEYVDRWMPDRKAATDAFRLLPSAKREQIVRTVLNEWGTVEDQYPD